MLVLVSRLSRSLFACSSCADLVLELRVDGAQLLVERLQLLLGGLELLVGGAQLLVDGHDLFVDDLQLFVGALEVPDAALQLLPGRLELVLELAGDRLVGLASRRPRRGRAGGRRLAARPRRRSAGAPPVLARSRERLHRDLSPGATTSPRRTRRDDDRTLAVADRLADRAAQLGRQAVAQRATSGPGWGRRSAGPDSPASVPRSTGSRTCG